MSQQINLFNPIFLKQKKYFSAVTIVQALGLLFLGMIGFYVYAVIEVGALTRQAGEGAVQYRQVQERLAKATVEFGVKEASVPLDQEVKTLQANLQARQSLLAGLNTGAFGSRYGLSEYMRALARRTRSGLWLTGFRVDEGGDTFTISGNALHADLVPAFVRGLGQEKMMQGRSLENLSMTSRQFLVPSAADGKPLQVSIIGFSLGSGAVAATVEVPRGGEAKN